MSGSSFPLVRLSEECSYSGIVMKMLVTFFTKMNAKYTPHICILLNKQFKFAHWLKMLIIEMTINGIFFRAQITFVIMFFFFSTNRSPIYFQRDTFN